jgi:hypothetical protein
LVGIEIGENTEKDFNPPSLHSKTSTQIWDELLTIFAPARNIYGIITDDSHGTPVTATAFFGLRWTEILVPENTSDSERINNVKESMRNGRSFCMLKANNNNAISEYNLSYPSVTNIVVNETDMTISIECTGNTKIEWVSRGQVIAGATNKKTLSPDEFNLEKYVRFKITGANGSLYSQPFLLVEKDK